MLEINGVDVYYSEMQALRQVSLQVQEGEIVGLVGANGAGKSTLLKTISGLMEAKSGEIKFKGQFIHRSRAHTIVDLGIAHVPEGRRLFPHMTVLENLLVGSSIKRAKAHREETLKKIYRLFPRLEERTKQAAGTLSGGEQQMVAIARALMSQPRLLMLDETSLGLAPVVVLDIFKTLKQIRDQEGLTIMLVEQNVQHCLNLADRGYVLENGEVVMEGKGQDLLHDPHLKEHYLGL